MNIGWVIPCRYVEIHDNLATIVGAGIDTLWVQEIPSQIQLWLAIRLTALAEEFTEDQQHATVTRIKDPSGNVVSEMKGEFSVGAESAKPDYLVGVTLPALVQIEVSEEGTYALELEFDDAWTSLPVHVVHGQPGLCMDSLGRRSGLERGRVTGSASRLVRVDG